MDSMFAAIRKLFVAEKGQRFRTCTAFSSLLVFAVALGSVYFGPSLADSFSNGSDDFEVGRVADRDVAAERSVVYVDEEATRLRREAQERLVPAVFRFSAEIGKQSLASFARFSEYSRTLFKGKGSAEAYALAVQAEFPGLFNRDTLDAIHRASDRSQLLDAAESALRIVMNAGVLALPASGLDGFNPDLVEILRVSGGRNERERIPIESAATLTNISRRITAVVSNGTFPRTLVPVAADLIRPFVAENAFFSSEDSNVRLDEARARVLPITKRIEQGERVIRKGFIVNQADLERYKALGFAHPRRAPGKTVGIGILLALLLAIGLSSLSPRVLGRVLKSSEVYVIAAFAVLYILGAAVAKGFSGGGDYFPSSIYIPTALLTMLLAVLMGTRAALAFAFSLPAVAFVCGFFDMYAYVFDVVSAVVGVFALQGSERRVDLVRAGAVIAVVQAVSAAGLILALGAPTTEFASTVFWASFNGFVCGMTILGFLPLFEHLLDAVTPYRLIELSDLNSPILKRLLTAAPGTYSHSVTVANLAESACREIGADPLLARVGAYYHDIGKMDQPEYFIENQTAYNKHEDIQPRLSATVIRSHVKLGIEKARKLGLPKQVIDIIAEHHGNSVISWFYNEAVKREDQVSADDFSYPGTPPKTKESAVVMLADSVEAAVRTLKKPTVGKLDKFVQELILSKFDQDQLSESELTFKDLETIKNAFVRVLAGHYHSRIEYPKLKERVG